VEVEVDAAERAALAEFLAQHPEYSSTRQLDELRATEYRRLDATGHVYLDYTGGSLHAECQVREHAELLNRGLYGNPHSASPTSSETTRLVEETRRAVLAWFGASPGEYTAVFTSNATGALKHVGESYPFGSDGQLLLTTDNHNSVNGIREFAVARGASVEYAPLTVPDFRIDRGRLASLLAGNSGGSPGGRKLFGFPAQSNFSGVKHPLELVAAARSEGWHVLLDAAAFVPTNRLNLGAVPADFVSVSFYKMFGYPTGVGCLLIRNEVLPALSRPWFSGGTVNFASVQGRRHVLSPNEAGFEDGTLDYLSIPAVGIGLRHLESVGMEVIQTRVRCLTSWLLDQLLDLCHTNGRHMVRVYGPSDMTMRGATVTMNFYDPEGRLLDYRRVEEMAAARDISVRTGCFCNPGGAETAEGLTEDDMLAGAAEGVEMNLLRFQQLVARRSGKSVGALRVSLGIASNFADVYRVVDFVRGLLDETRLTLDEVSFDVESYRGIRDGS
jgi:selenocysteine lyase/cysteine desulfurase